MTVPRIPPQWNRDTKILVTVVVLLIVVGLTYLARDVIPLMALAAVIAYIFQPLLDWLVRQRVPRGLAAALCVLLLVLVVAIGPVLLTPATVNGVRAIIDVLVRLPDLFQQWMTSLAETEATISLLGFSLDLSALSQQLQSAAAGTLSEFQFPSLGDLVSYAVDGLRTATGLLQTAAGIATGVASAALSSLLLLLYIFYLTKDGTQLGVQLNNLILPQYHEEVRAVGHRLNLVWRSFFRGQIVLSLVVGFVVFLATSLLGLPGAFVLGITAGVLEVIPNLGPVLAMIPAVLLALVQGPSYLPVSNLVFAAIVVLVYFLIQQVENNVLVPRIMGQSLNLHPLLVLVGVVVGTSTAGVLGAFLAAPLLASLKVLGWYVHAKLTNQDPLAQPLAIATPAVRPKSGDSGLKRWLQRVRPPASLQEPGQPAGATPADAPAQPGADDSAQESS